MQLVQTTPEEVAGILDVLGVVATARGTEAPTAADQAVIASAAKHLLGATELPARLATHIRGDIAEVLAAPGIKDLTMHLVAILCFADITKSKTGKEAYLDPRRIAIADDLARYLRISQKDMKDLRALAKHHRDRIAFDLFRRFVRGTYGDDMNMVRTTVIRTKTKLGMKEKDAHALWNRLELLPEGTVGAELIRYYHDNGWKYPGTDRHQPLMFAEHDVHHVLGGYATTPSGELRVGAFTAGVAERPLDCALYFLMWEQLGVASRAIPGAVGAFEPEPFFAALERGAQTTHEFIGNGWDPWSIVSKSLEEVRADYRIGPGAQLADGDPYNKDPVRSTT